jgi:predicted glycosyltransferase involved in capsule biosynthesis
MHRPASALPNDSMTTPRISMIATVRASSEARQRNLAYVLDWYQQMPGWELLVVEQDSAPRLDSTDWPFTRKRLYVVNGGPFNKAWGFNVGAKAAHGDILFFCDADLLLEHSALKAAASLCSRHALAVNPFDRLIDLNPADTAAILVQGQSPDFAREDASPLRGDREKLCFCGGAFFMRRSLHHAMGGLDERFVGWGAEDDAMTLRMQRMTTELAVLEGRAAVHLWHERSDASTFGNPHYPNNLRMLQELAGAPDDSVRFLCDLQRQIMGHPGKYENGLVHHS